MANADFYNLRNPAVKRLMREAEELQNATDEYYAQPLDDNLFEWHFTVRGPPSTDFDGGVYHGRITLPPDYPMKPPSIILLTPNGRFEVNKKICLSISGHHPESWQPSWSIRTALLAIIGFMPTHGNGAIGSLDYKPEERKTLAQRSKRWKCLECGHINLLLKEVTTADDCTVTDTKGNKSINSVCSNEAERNGNISQSQCSKVPKTCDAESQCTDNIATNGLCVSKSPMPSNTTQELDKCDSETFITSNVTSDPHSRVRQRRKRPETNQENHSNDETLLVQVEDNSYQFLSGKYFTACMWIIVLIIASLLIRRILFIQ